MYCTYVSFDMLICLQGVLGFLKLQILFVSSTNSLVNNTNVLYLCKFSYANIFARHNGLHEVAKFTYVQYQFPYS